MTDTTETVEILPHHPCGPSSLYRRQQCPGSLKMELHSPETPDTDGSRERGVLLHAMTYNWELRVDLTGEEEEQLAACDAVLDSIPGAVWQHEQRVTARRPWSSEPMYFGTIDAYCIDPANPDVAHIIDWKFGRVEVDAPEYNLQLAAYALALYDELHPQISEVRATIVQPALRKEGHKTHTFTDLNSLRRLIADIIKAASDPDVWTLKAGSHCTYCKAKSKCPAFNALILPVHQGPASVPITNDNAASFHMRRKLLSKACDEMAAHLKAYVIAQGGKVGEPGNGLELVKRPGNREITDIEAAFKVAANYLTTTEFLALCKASVPKVEDAIARRMVANGAAKTLKAAKEIIGKALPIGRGEDVEELKTY